MTTTVISVVPGGSGLFTVTLLPVVKPFKRYVAGTAYINVTVSPSAIPIPGSPIGLTVVLAAAPSLSACAFEDSGASIVCTFNRDTDQGSEALAAVLPAGARRFVAPTAESPQLLLARLQPQMLPCSCVLRSCRRRRLRSLGRGRRACSRRIRSCAFG